MGPYYIPSIYVRSMSGTIAIHTSRIAIETTSNTQIVWLLEVINVKSFASFMYLFETSEEVIYIYWHHFMYLSSWDPEKKWHENQNHRTIYCERKKNKYGARTLIIEQTRIRKMKYIRNKLSLVHTFWRLQNHRTTGYSKWPYLRTPQLLFLFIKANHSCSFVHTQMYI